MFAESKVKTGSWTDYLALTKPRVVLLHIITAAAAMVIAAAGAPPAALLVATLAGGGLVAGAANVLNCYFDIDIDRSMRRTANRPLPAGRVQPGQALVFALAVALTGLCILEWVVGWKTAVLAVTALLYYIIIYTLWLKRLTFWGSLIGSGAGAFPPLIGWIAVTGQIGVVPFILFALIVLWTPPHFWSLAMFRRQDYARAGLSMLPASTGSLWVTVFAWLLVAASALLIPAAGLGKIYSFTALILGTGLISLAAILPFETNPPQRVLMLTRKKLRIWRPHFCHSVLDPESRNPDSGAEAGMTGENGPEGKKGQERVGQTGEEKTLRTARWLYVYSIGYLTILFAAMIIDRVVR
jgi:protoheme IX farnesyltransferase